MYTHLSSCKCNNRIEYLLICSDFISLEQTLLGNAFLISSDLLPFREGIQHFEYESDTYAEAADTRLLSIIVDLKMVHFFGDFWGTSLVPLHSLPKELPAISSSCLASLVYESNRSSELILGKRVIERALEVEAAKTCIRCFPLHTLCHLIPVAYKELGTAAI